MNNFVPEFLSVLTRYGWVPLSSSKDATNVEILTIKNGHKQYVKPKVVSKYPYQGILKRVETDSIHIQSIFDNNGDTVINNTHKSEIFLKPASLVISKDKQVSGKSLVKFDSLDKIFMSQQIVNIEDVQGQGNLVSLFFGV